MVSWTDFNQISYKTNFDSKAVYVSIQHGFVKFLCRNLFTITLHCSSHSGSGQKVCKCTFQNGAAACWQVNAVWSACLQSVLPNQTMRLLPSLLQLIFLPTHQPALTEKLSSFSAANLESQGRSLITRRVEEIWEKYASFSPRCSRFPQRDVCLPTEKFLPSIDARATFLKVKLLFGQPHGVGAITMMDNTCAFYTFYQGRPVGIATFYRGGKMIRMQEGEIQWTRRSLGPVVWFEQQRGKVRLLVARVEGIEEEVAVVRNGAAPQYSRATLDTRVTQGLPNESESLPNVQFVEEKGAEKIHVGNSLVSSFFVVLCLLLVQ